MTNWRKISICCLFLFSVFTKCQGLCDIPSSTDVIEVTGWTGIIMSPGIITGMYPNYQDCTWEVRVTPGSKVKVVFELFDLEEGVFRNGSPAGEKLCSDYIKISDSTGDIFENCGALTPPVEVTSSGEALTIVFHSDESGTAKGFKLSYTGVCEGDVTSGSILYTPNYPDTPPQGVTCQWKIGSNEVLVNIVKHLDVSYTTNDDHNHTLLPRCGRSPLQIISVNSNGEKNELCLSNSAQAYSDSVTLIYDTSSADTERWVGQLKIDVSNDLKCNKFCVHSTGCQPQKEQSKIIYNCDCQPGYKGLTCEDEVDSCNSNPCVYGKCTNMPGIGMYNCLCEAGFTGTECQTKMTDACSDFQCYNAGLCQINGEDEPFCQCPKEGEYTGTLCNIHVDAAHCQMERDDTPGSFIVWADTLSGGLDVRPCPRDTIGNATRNCIKDPHSPTGGLWTRPDLSMCVSPEILQISKDSQMLLQDSERDNTNLLLNITSRLVIATEPVLDSTPEWHPLFPGDLITVADIMGTVSEAANNVDLDEDVALKITQKYTSSVDNVIDPKAVSTWRNALAKLVERKVSNIVDSTQKLVTNIMRRNQDLRLRISTRITGRRNVDSFTVLAIPARNLDIKVTEIAHQRLSGVPLEYSGPTSTISLPGSILNGTEYRLLDKPVHIYFARFLSISTLLSISECRYHKEHQNDSNVLNSDIISAEFLDFPKSSFQHLQQPVTITFLLQDPQLRKDLDKMCVFMNMSAETYEERWSTSGCYVSDSNETHVVCSCYHLTNFAVLMDVYDNQGSLDETNETILTYVSYIGGSLSVIACIITIVVFQYFRLSSDRIRIHQQLGLSIILVQVLFVCVGKTGKEYGTPLWGCRTLSILMHYSLTAMFCWMLVEGMHLYVVLVRVFKLGSHLKKYIAVGWGIPLLVVGISVGAFYERYGNEDLCWLDHELLLVVFVPTVGLVVLINTVILCVVIRVMIKSNSSTNKVSAQERNSIQMGIKAAAVLLPLLGLTWVLGFLAIDADDSKVVSYIFTYLFTISNSFQGVLFFVFHCLLNVDVHLAYERRYKREKRSSYVETTSSKLRKMSEPDVYHGNNVHRAHSKSTNTTRSTLTDLSLGDHRLSYPNHDKHPIINLDDLNSSDQFSNLWSRFQSDVISNPGYPEDFQDGGLSKTLAYSPQRRITDTSNDVTSNMMIPRPHRNSVRFT